MLPADRQLVDLLAADLVQLESEHNRLCAHFVVLREMLSEALELSHQAIAHIAKLQSARQ